MAEPAVDRFGTLLRRRRMTAGLSQEELAERAKLSAQGISALERGHRASPRPETVRLLAAALGLDAQARAELIAAARAGVRPAVDAPVVAPPSALRPLPLPLPLPPTRLVGREREVATICAALRRDDHLAQGALGTRLLTLTGPGGVGKTRLALAAARELVDAFADGVAWVELAPIHDRPERVPELMATAIARVVGAREVAGQSVTAALAAALRRRTLLLVLDNCEHVLAAAPLVAELLAGCEGLRVLATSRVRLQLRGEREVPVAPLAVPDQGTGDRGQGTGEQSLTPDARPLPPEVVVGLAGVAAVRLFVERAAEIRPGFTLTAENAAAVAAICRRLDGLPLAIELAATQVKLLPPAELLARLGRRLPLLTGGPRDAPARHQTMRDAIAWSHDLLGENEQALFRRLAVFVGGFAVDAAEAVVATGWSELELLDAISALVDRSLLIPLAPVDAEPRFGMLETVREYGLERLVATGEVDATRRRHALCFLEATERIEPLLFGAGQIAAVARLEVDRDNHRAALAWLEQAGESDHLLRLAGALGPFWDIHGPLDEGREWLDRALTMSRPPDRPSAAAATRPPPRADRHPLQGAALGGSAGPRPRR